jgi:microcystin-dependent protein
MGLPRYREFDDNGAPLAAGRLYTFQAGTSTPATTYLNSALTIPNTNPIVLDAAGRATIFIPDASVMSYLFIQNDANDVTLWSQDDISIPQIPTPTTPAVVPTGSILAWGGSTAPTDYLLCNGSAVSRTTYADLFAITGTAFGVGNGTTTFNLPDLRGRFPLGKAASGTGSTLGGTGGTIDHVHTGPSHTHTSPAHSHSMAHTHTVPRDNWSPFTLNATPVSGRISVGDAAGGGAHATEIQPNQDNTSGGSSAANTGSTIATTDASGTGNTGTANPAFQAVNFIIKI